MQYGECMENAKTKDKVVDTVSSEYLQTRSFESYNWHVRKFIMMNMNQDLLLPSPKGSFSKTFELKGIKASLLSRKAFFDSDYAAVSFIVETVLLYMTNLER